MMRFAVTAGGWRLSRVWESPLNTVAGTKKRETATADCPAASPQ